MTTCTPTPDDQPHPFPLTFNDNSESVFDTKDFIMPLSLQPLAETTRLLVEVDLRPIQGARFQPTGFPDLGAAVYETAAGTRLLVESPQSMANRLEATIWDDATRDLIAACRGLSYVRVNRADGSYLTSTITESHRLNSPYILEGTDNTLHDALKSETGTLETGSIDRQQLARVIFKYDVNALIHGVFLAKDTLAGGRLRLERALSSFVEAEGVRVAAWGGVKKDEVDPTGTQIGLGSNKGFGHVPFQRDEYTADRITAFFSLDLAQIRGYGLDAAQTDLLIALALYKMAAFIEGDKRFRTACDFDTVAVRVTRPNGFVLPTRAAIAAELPALIARTASAFAGQNGITTVRYEKGEKKAKKA
jgi:CRISPR-associated protein Csb1